MLVPERAKKKKEKKKISLLLPPARLKAPKKSKKVLLIVFCSILVGASFYGIFFSGFFNLKSWDIEEDGVLLTKDNPLYQYVAQEREKSMFLINGDRIIKEITSLKPNIKKIEVKKIFPRKIKVIIEKYPIVANLINVIGDDKIDNSPCKIIRPKGEFIQKKLSIDSTGYIAEENNENPELPYIRVNTPKELEVGTFANKDKTDFLTTKKLDYILKTINLFKESFNMKVIEVSYKDTEREVHLCTEKYFTVWIDMEKDPAIQIQKLSKTIPKLDIYKTPLEYIDLRISGTNNEKIIFKRKH